MCKEMSLCSLEEAIDKGQGLLERVRTQNEQWPGAGAFEVDVRNARALLGQMERALADLIASLTQRKEDPPGENLEVEAVEAVNRTYSLISQLYDDVHTLHIALERGQSQSSSLEQTIIHFRQLADHCKHARNRLSEARRRVEAV